MIPITEVVIACGNVACHFLKGFLLMADSEYFESGVLWLHKLERRVNVNLVNWMCRCAGAAMQAWPTTLSVVLPSCCSCPEILVRKI